MRIRDAVDTAIRLCARPQAAGVAVVSAVVGQADHPRGCRLPVRDEPLYVV